MTPPYGCYEYLSPNPTATMALGQCLGTRLQACDIVALHGDLGTGKTVLTQGVGRGLGITGRIVSPTFVLANEYVTPAGLRLRHVDCYRLPTGNTRSEAANLGLDEWLADDQCVLVIEWADRIPALLPTERLTLTLHHGHIPEERRIHIRATGARYVTLLADLNLV